MLDVGYTLIWRANRLDRALQGLALLVALGAGEHRRVRFYRQLECLTIVLGRGERRGVVGEIRASQLVLWKALNDVAPPPDP